MNKVFEITTNGVDTNVSNKEARHLLKKAKQTDDFLSFAKKNTNDSLVEYTFGKGEMEPAFEKTAFVLKISELSDIVEIENGYHILYCVSEFDEDATKDKKENIISETQDKVFEKLYAQWTKD